VIVEVGIGCTNEKRGDRRSQEDGSDSVLLAFGFIFIKSCEKVRGEMNTKRHGGLKSTRVRQPLKLVLDNSGVRNSLAHLPAIVTLVS